MPEPIRVLLLFSDTGGGHRSAAEALVEAWEAEYPGRVRADLVDFFHYYAPFPFNRAGPTYPKVIKYFSPMYAAVFRSSDTPRTAWTIARGIYGYTRPAFRRMLAQHPADVVVSVHPLANHVINWTMHGMGLHAPFITVVTDLLTVHALWFYPHATHIIGPTEGARERGISYGVTAERITVRGLPVAQKFSTCARGQAALSKVEARAQLGLRPDRPVVLVIGGGEGMGPVGKVARVVDEALASDGIQAQLAVITGRNQILRERLQASEWHLPARVEGFVTNMPEWMMAADVLVTKAGPGTITEGLIAGLPLILMARIAGQEDGNVDYVVSERVGVWEPRAARVAERLREWLEPGNPALAEMSMRARLIAHPNAASEIAGDVLAIADKML